MTTLNSAAHPKGKKEPGCPLVVAESEFFPFCSFITARRFSLASYTHRTTCVCTVAHDQAGFWLPTTVTIDGALKRINGKLVKGKTKRESSKRTIPLPAVTIAALERHVAGQERERLFAGDRWKDTGYIFTTRIGTPIERRNLLRDWYKLMAGSGLPQIRFHDLRHSAATLLMLQGVHPRTVMELLGHKDLNTTMKIYGHVVDAMKQDAANRIDQLFAPVATKLATTEQPSPRPN